MRHTCQPRGGAASRCRRPTPLLLAPPSLDRGPGSRAGKSTLLKLLAGRLKGETGVVASGEVLYNGSRGDDFVLERSAAYIDQADEHLPTQTVHDLLRFAWQCQSGGARAPSSSPETRKSWLPPSMDLHPQVRRPVKLIALRQPAASRHGQSKDSEPEALQERTGMGDRERVSA